MPPVAGAKRTSAGSKPGRYLQTVAVFGKLGRSSACLLQAGRLRPYADSAADSLIGFGSDEDIIGLG